MANIEKLKDKRETERKNEWLVKLDKDAKKYADEILSTRIKNNLCSPAGKDRDGYKDIFKAVFRDKEMINKLKTYKFQK
jgi:hypothetical protein